MVGGGWLEVALSSINVKFKVLSSYLPNSAGEGWGWRGDSNSAGIKKNLNR